MEDIKVLKKRARDVMKLLKKTRPDIRIELEFSNPLQLLIATILSAQCTDKTVNNATKKLFAAYSTADDFARLPLRVLEKEIKTVNYYRTKAKNIKACCQKIVDEHNGNVPADRDVLVQFPGIGQKTANVILGNGFGIAAGIVVDTHVRRVANRLGLTAQQDPKKIEADLVCVVPQKDWIAFSTLVVLQGRYVCKAAKPLCGECVLHKICSSAFR